MNDSCFIKTIVRLEEEVDVWFDCLRQEKIKSFFLLSDEDFTTACLWQIVLEHLKNQVDHL